MFGKFFKSKNKNQGNNKSKATGHPTNFDDLHEKAFLHSQALEEIFDQNWQTDQAERFDVDLVQKRIWWTFKNGDIIEAPATLIGTWSDQSQTFLWGWDHPACPPADNAAARAVLAYAEEHDILELKLRKIELSESDALQVASIGVLLGDLKGLFAPPSSNGNRLFVGFGDIEKSNL